ncbi:MAG: hypothetical protein ACPG49_08955 [Chitinophagales bacterium]
MLQCKCTGDSVNKLDIVNNRLDIRYNKNDMSFLLYLFWRERKVYPSINGLIELVFLLINDSVPKTSVTMRTYFLHNTSLSLSSMCVIPTVFTPKPSKLYTIQYHHPNHCNIHNAVFGRAKNPYAFRFLQIAKATYLLWLNPLK